MPTERPAAITRRRLEQAGYDQADSLDYIAAEDMTFLLKFVYKSQRLDLPVGFPLLLFGLFYTNIYRTCYISMNLNTWILLGAAFPPYRSLFTRMQHQSCTLIYHEIPW